jgi:O-antigen ligase
MNAASKVIPPIPAASPKQPVQSRPAPPIRPKGFTPALFFQAPARASGSCKIAVILLLLIYSRISDLLAMKLGSIATILGPILVFTVLGLAVSALTGGMRRALLSPVGIFFLAFSGLLIVGVPGSVWPGGSVGVLKDYWFKSVADFICVVGLLTTLDDIRLALNAICCGVLFVILQSFLLGTEGRLALSEGMLGNPNSLAFFLAALWPICWVVAQDRSRAMKAVGIITCLLLPIVTFHTGSRMGLVMLVVGCGFLFLMVSGMKKFLLVLAGAAVTIVLVATSSEEIIERYKLILADQEDLAAAFADPQGQAAMAAGSSMSRKALRKAAWELTLAHPLLGIGPGMFAVATGSERGENKKDGVGWHETHNTYLQISSEAGIPAALLYVGALLYCIRSTWLLYRSRAINGLPASFGSYGYALLASCCIAAIGMAFGSYAYNLDFPILAALVTVLFSAANAQLAISRRAVRTPA